jgi:hypothetical protein
MAAAMFIYEETVKSQMKSLFQNSACTTAPDDGGVDSARFAPVGTPLIGGV